MIDMTPHSLHSNLLDEIIFVKVKQTDRISLNARFGGNGDVGGLCGGGGGRGGWVVGVAGGGTSR